MSESHGRLLERNFLLFSLASLLASCGTIFDPETYPHAPAGPAPPEITAPRYAGFLRGQADSMEFTAQDANGDPIDSVRADLTALPAGHDATFATFPLPGSSAVRCRLRWSAQATDTGLYPVRFTAVNDVVGPPDTAWIYTIDHPEDSAPIVSCPDTLHLVAGQPRTISVSADDPDGDPIFEFWPGQPLGGSELLPFHLLSWDRATSGPRATGTLSIRANRPGTYSVSFTAINAAHGFGTTRLYASAP